MVQLAHTGTIPDPGHIKTVMVVDEPDHARFVKTILQEHGYAVDTAKDGGQAHATFMVRKPDFVILELVLPGESGFEICERLKKLDKTIPVLVLTEVDLDAARNLAARVGVDGYLTKPFDPDVLLEMIPELGEAVWERTHGGQTEEKGTIRFHCRCGKKISMRLRDKGKAMRCPRCQERVDVPEWAGSRRARFYVSRPGPEDAPASRPTEPLKFVTIKCQHCGTYYRLFPDAMENARTCPKCLKQQGGALSIVGAPLSRAALASSRRVLIIRSGPNKGKKLLLPNKEVVIGRYPQCDIRHDSDQVSGKHCRLRLARDGLLVQDLNSATGTLINGKAIQEETLLAPGDRLQVGPLQLQLAGRRRPEDEQATGNATWLSDQEQTEASIRAEIERAQFKDTAEESAKVIQLYWEIVRKRALLAAEDRPAT
jgi:CheY-like chemotaxis protein